MHTHLDLTLELFSAESLARHTISRSTNTFPPSVVLPNPSFHPIMGLILSLTVVGGVEAHYC